MPSAVTFIPFVSFASVMFTSDFTVTDNYIKRKKRLIAVYEIRPYDIALLNDEDRDDDDRYVSVGGRRPGRCDVSGSRSAGLDPAVFAR